MGAWSGLGFNIGHNISTAAFDLTGSTGYDLALLKKMGVTKVRLPFRPYSSVNWQFTRDLAAACKARGFYVIAGVTAGANTTLTVWNAYLAALPTITASFEGLVDEWAFANEPELNAQNGDGTLLVSQIPGDLKTVAATLQGVTSAVLSVNTDEGNITSWATAGLGANIDRIGFNVYNTDANFVTKVASIASNFSSTGYISEFNTAGGYKGAAWNEESYAANLAWRLQVIRSYNIMSAYLFSLRDGAYNVEADRWALLPTSGQRVALSRLTGTRNGVTL